MGLQYFSVQGNLTRDLELRYTPNGVAVLDFTVAVNDVYRTKDGVKQEKTTYYDLIAWNKNAENIAKFFKKGRPIIVESRRGVNDSWEDKKTGEKRSRLKFEVDKFHFVGGPKDSGPAQDDEPEENTPSSNLAGDDDDDTPF